MRSRLRGSAALFACVCLALGCGLLAGTKRSGSVSDGREFPHETHMDEGFSCVDCHKTSRTDERAGMPTASTCNVCHEDFLTEPEEFPEVAAFFPGGEASWHGISALGGDLQFSHGRHARARVECAACHGNVAQTGAVRRAVRVDKDDCLDCHAKKGVTSDCAACHEYIRRDARPASHGPIWSRRHGEVARGPQRDAPRYRCSQCHTEGSCDGCHLREPPSGHSALWRRRTHGIAAGFDRDRCATCHRSDACLECHETTRPQSHVASWGSSPAWLHCSDGCHVSASGAGCATCHRSLQGHADAPPLAGASIPPHPFPQGGLRCTVCHNQ